MITDITQITTTICALITVFIVFQSHYSIKLIQHETNSMRADLETAAFARGRRTSAQTQEDNKLETLSRTSGEET